MNLVHLLGFITNKFITMHGHMNVKKVSFTVFVIFTQVTHPKTLHLAYTQKQFIHSDVLFKVTSPVSLIHSSTEREVECV